MSGSRPFRAGERGPRPGAARGVPSWLSIRRPALLAVATAALLVAAALVVGLMPRPGGPARTIVASVPYWNIGAGTDTTLANRQDFTGASPWLFGLDAEGRVVPLYGPSDTKAVTDGLARLRGGGLNLVPTLANVVNGRFSDQPVASIMREPAARAAHIAAIVALVTERGFGGIDIDYEELSAGDRTAFTEFVSDLAAALHGRGKTLSVALFAKTTDAGYDQRNLAQDYAAVGRVADEVRLMAYDYHWAASAPGPVAPVGWVQNVLAYARTQIPPAKIVLGIPLSGYDWPAGGDGTVVTTQQVAQLVAQHQAVVRFDARSQSPTLSYDDSAGRFHQVWFENAASTRAKLDAARAAGIGGVYFWMYGPADPGTWAQLSEAFPRATGGR
ncbi:glycosyl hydrolase family 18 protein [Amycolatopsis benzoatilytica]|uniref:glycosyl hydrolase family 18 protein n=1 Tax=Amycolatopsis benzoatilytica TaxID=346045 RepID=UPI0003765D11|nr:glycosyl hydrolase family 18 protein [Amycolatopsis benzoatilytica]